MGRACHYLTNCRWRQGGVKVASRWHESSAKAPRRLHEAIMVAPQTTTEAPRRPRERSMTPSRRIHFVDAPAPPRLLRRVFVEPLRSLYQFNNLLVKPKLPQGRFHSDSAIPSAKPCVVSIFGLGLGLGLELRLCKKMSTAPPRRHHGCFAEPSRSHRQFVK